ncbi:hypothetical protein BB559_002409 [Furculomyces boomerangus]|uniref:Rab-GAP TBC domain-containing protein n=1 Tax=Furculomyces boomerangus TaxID=61424 RepID=A0A2T9YVK9_9FUNG|nr:hypothetical protein BB559_002409 [Furculomyces boomerangus]
MIPDFTSKKPTTERNSRLQSPSLSEGRSFWKPSYNWSFLRSVFSNLSTLISAESNSTKSEVNNGSLVFNKSNSFLQTISKTTILKENSLDSNIEIKKTISSDFVSPVNLISRKSIEFPNKPNTPSSPKVDIDTKKFSSGNTRALKIEALLDSPNVEIGMRGQTIVRKRKEYDAYLEKSFTEKQNALDTTMWHQISIDIPRTNPKMPLFRNKKIQTSLARLLYCWASRNPASGYVQGINDLAAVFYSVFVTSYMDQNLDGIENMSDDTLTSITRDVEADCFWCLTSLINKIQDSFTLSQPGIQRQIAKLQDLVANINPALYKHFESEGIQFVQFSFRWFNCLLTREFTLENTIRIWDTYLSEPDGFSTFHLYTCTALLLKWSDQLLKMDFQSILLFLQTPPCLEWTLSEVEILLSEAYTYKRLYSYSSLLPQNNRKN